MKTENEVADQAVIATAWKGLTDVQWMNIVNHDHCWESYSKEDAVHEAVKMVEAKLKEINSNAVAASVQGVPPGWREFIENIATPYSEPLNSASGCKDKESRQQWMAILRETARALLIASPLPSPPVKEQGNG